MLELKEYQKRALEDLESYLKGASRQGAKTAFVLQTGRPYREVTQLPGLPAHSGPRVIYGEACRLGDSRLRTGQITFKQVPYQIKVN
jgi:hypothetical protein